MKSASIGVLTSLLSTSVVAQTVNFDADVVGAAPSGWTCGVTGRGSPRWEVAAEPGAPSGANVLRQSGRGTFPWCVSPARLVDALVEVKFKSISGREDQAGGLVWRWKDGEHYYVARANALENNVSLYYTRREAQDIRYVDAPVSAVPGTPAVEFVAIASRFARRQALYRCREVTSPEKARSASGPRPTA